MMSQGPPTIAEIYQLGILTSIHSTDGAYQVENKDRAVALSVSVDETLGMAIRRSYCHFQPITWDFDGTGSSQPAEVKQWISGRLPSSLLIQLCRNPDKLDGYHHASMVIPSYLDLSDLLQQGTANTDQGAVYALRSIVMHQGYHGGGHYYCIAYNPPEGSWFKFDDSRMSRMSEEEVIRISSGLSADAGEKAYTLSSSAYGAHYASSRSSSSVEGPTLLRYELVAKAPVVDVPMADADADADAKAALKEVESRLDVKQRRIAGPLAPVPVERLHVIKVTGDIVLRLGSQEEFTTELVLKEMERQLATGKARGTLLPSESLLVLKGQQDNGVTAGGGRYQILLRFPDTTNGAYFISQDTTPLVLVNAALKMQEAHNGTVSKDHRLLFNGESSLGYPNG